jgi:hypothetical protein
MTNRMAPMTTPAWMKCFMVEFQGRGAQGGSNPLKSEVVRRPGHPLTLQLVINWGEV